MLTIYKASAGSGKTYNLALTYIRHLLGYRNADSCALRPYKGATAHNHRSILAITFTNAATEEMKSRIVKRLAELATAPEKSDYRDELRRTFKEDLEVISKAARHALTELLYDYSNFYVSTIDSFFQTVLRTFAREVDQQGDYELSLEQDTIVPEVIALMLEELNREPEYKKSALYEWILKQAMEQAGEGKVPNFFERDGSLVGALARKVDKSLDEVYHSSGEDLEKYWANPALLRSFADEIQKRLKDIRKRQQKAARTLARLLKDQNVELKSVPERVIKTGAINPANIDKKDLEASTVTALVNRDDTLKAMATAKAEFRKRLSGAEQDHIADLVHDYIADLIGSQPVVELYGQLLDGALDLQFLALFRNNLDRYLRENNTLLISDTGELLKRIISDEEMPFIYERLGMRLNSLLIDEFQDTSSLQWTNLKPLVSNSIAQGGESLIIGDVKQSIYRFRNSDSALLDHVVQDDTTFEGFVVHRGAKPADNTNHRSAGDMVRFNNTFFHYMAESLGVESYASVIQELSPRKKDIPANINLSIRLKPEKGEAADDEKYQTWILETLASGILDQHRRGYRWRDIAILVNKHDQARKIVSYLLEHYPQIKILSNEALLLSNSPAVRTVMSVLALVEKDILDNPRADGVPEAQETVKIHSKADLTNLLTQFNYHRSKGDTPQDALQNALSSFELTEGSSLAERIHNIRKQNSPNLVALIEHIIHEEISEEDRMAQHAFLVALQDRAIAHCNGPDPSIAAFLRAYNHKINSWAIKAPSTLDAVRVMTIHASKGLEWPCVHIPYSTWPFYKGGSMWFRLDNHLPDDKGVGMPGFDPAIVPPIIRMNVGSSGVLYNADNFKAQAQANKQAEEVDNLNRLYVAFTRAGQELNVHFQGNKNAYTDTTLTAAVNVLQNLDGAVQTDPRMMDLKVENVEADENHSALLRFSYCTAGCPPVFTPEGDDSRETNITEAYEVVRRADVSKLIAVEDLFDLSDPLIGNEAEKEIIDNPYKDVPYSAEVAHAAQRGLHLHAILADMDSYSDLERALHRIAVLHSLEPDTEQEYRDILRKAFEKTPEAAAWFDPRNTVWNEQNIFDPHGGENSEGETLRPDRIVLRPDGSVVVVDYKFTYKEWDEHKNQVRAYIRLLRSMGYGNVSGALWYPRRHKVIAITN